MEPEVTQVSSFPDPPLHYIDQYTNERVAARTAPHPPPPLQGHYTVFGEGFNTEDEMLPPLDSLGIKRVYNASEDPRKELKRLTRSLVAAFLDLIEILIRCPDSPERLKKIEDLRLLFINTHHLINEYRPHQARDTLRLMLEVQQAERAATVDRFEQHFHSIKENLKTCLQELPQDLTLDPELKRDVEKILAEGGRTQSSTSANELIAEKDRIMCEIADAIS